MLLSNKSVATSGVHIYDPANLDWVSAGRDGISMKCVRRDDAKGHYLGLIAFEPFATSGVHQHLGPAFSYMLRGSLVDHEGAVSRGQVGINLEGATHEATAYEPCLLAARMEAPTLYEGKIDSNAPTLHAGATIADIVNRAPERPVDIVVDPAHVPQIPTSVGHVARRKLFDYAHLGERRTCTELAFLPGARCPVFTASAPIELFVIGGTLTINGAVAGSSHFAIIEPGARAQVASPFGARIIAWSEGAVAWDDGPGADLFGHHQ